MPESTFKWGDGRITVSSTTIRTRNKESYLNDLLNVTALSGWERNLGISAMYYLSHINRVSGDIGFHIPIDSPTEEDLHIFLDAFSEQDENLATLLFENIKRAKVQTNDPDLLPPEDIDPNA